MIHVRRFVCGLVGTLVLCLIGWLFTVFNFGQLVLPILIVLAIYCIGGLIHGLLYGE